MSARIADSLSYAHLWGTDELRDVFSEQGRLQGWLTVLAALARAQAAHGHLPAAAAAAITAEATVDRLDLERVAEGTRMTGHSTQGLILELRRVLSPDAAAWVYRDATVQDITDTWTALALRTVGGVCWRDLRRLEDLLLDLAARHRDADAQEARCEQQRPVRLGSDGPAGRLHARHRVCSGRIEPSRIRGRPR